MIYDYVVLSLLWCMKCVRWLWIMLISSCLYVFVCCFGIVCCRLRFRFIGIMFILLFGFFVSICNWIDFFGWSWIMRWLL